MRNKLIIDKSISKSVSRSMYMLTVQQAKPCIQEYAALPQYGIHWDVHRRMHHEDHCVWS